ncbi:MAG: carbohydrate-binding family 9-like protein [Planctomycetes bacterium]|nr:carbohydrate-binding family 9-like protein [Planctomycetota bacterium]
MKSMALPLVVLGACSLMQGGESGDGPWQGDGGRQGYVCLRAAERPVIDGRLDDACWRGAPSTRDFVDIRGGGLPAPRFATRAKLLWDDRCLYVAAELEEPHVWATLADRDAVIYHDDDFEVFIDPDGDTHRYVELEVNALATEWDLLLARPYRDGGPAIDAFDLAGLETGVFVDGTLNDPGDVDRGWSVEIAMPWEALADVAGAAAPPAPGDTWWVDFSRVEWRVRVEDGRYVKETDPATGKPLPEDNWVWSAPGVVDMHRPETWGLVRFSAVVSGEGEEEFVPPDDLAARRLLRRIYDAQQASFRESGFYTLSAAALGIDNPGLAGWRWPPQMWRTPSLFEAVLLREGGGRLHITQDGRIWQVAE